VVQLPDALGQRRWARLQDVSGLDLVDVAVANGRHITPPVALRDLLRLHRFATPRRDDHIRPTANHVFCTDDALFAEFGVAQLGEDRIAAGDVDEFFDPANARDQRVVPFFKEDARAARQRCRSGADRIDLELEMRDEAIGLVGAPDQRAKNADHLQNLGDAALIEDHHRVPALD